MCRHTISTAFVRTHCGASLDQFEYIMMFELLPDLFTEERVPTRTESYWERSGALNISGGLRAPLEKPNTLESIMDSDTFASSQIVSVVL